jgi:hypothetical protein
MGALASSFGVFGSIAGCQLLEVPANRAKQLIILRLPNGAGHCATGHGCHVGNQLPQPHRRQAAPKFGEGFDQFVVH